MTAAKNPQSNVQPHTSSNPCTICGGHDAMSRGKGIRCYGFRSHDGSYDHCTREEYAGALSLHKGGDTYAHRLEGSCRCGVTHGGFTQPKPERKPRSEKPPTPWTFSDSEVGTFHPYRVNGEVAFEVARFTEKARDERGRQKCMPRYREGGRWYCGLGPWNGRDDSPLYREDEAVSELLHGGTAYVTEGEKDADAIVEADGMACCNVGGALKFRREHAARLVDALRKGEPHARLVIVRDMDDPGRQHAEDVLAKLRKAGAPRDAVAVLEPIEGHDAADALADGRTLEESFARVEPVAEFEPYPIVAWSDMRPRLQNARLVKGVLDEQSLIVLYGSSGSSKTFTAIELAVAIGSGTPWRGHKTKRGRGLGDHEREPERIRQTPTSDLGLTHLGPRMT